MKPPHPPQQQLHMRWPESRLHVPPPVTAPAGYTIRPLNDNEDDGYLAVMQAAGFRHATPAFLQQWRQIAFPDGIFVAVEQATGCVAATALASHRPTGLHPHGAEIGWVAGLPTHAGRGLGAAVCAAAVCRSLDAGYRHLYLSTDDWRLAAIKVYLALGFVPYLFMDDMASRWQAVCAQLGWVPDPAGWISADPARWLVSDPHDRPDRDTVSRYRPRHRWLPDRPHRGYACNGDVDAFGDESLYHPSRLGTATIEPTVIAAGGTAPLCLTFQVGPDGLHEGATVTFVIRGQAPLGDGMPQPTIRGPAHCRYDAVSFGFTVRDGSLAAGETVQWQCPPFTWTPLAGRREFKVVITPCDGQPERRLPEPVSVDIQPGPIRRLELLMPCTHRGSTPLTVHVTTRDEFDNRVPTSGPVTVRADGAAIRGYRRDGLAVVAIPPPPAGVTTATASIPRRRCPVTANRSIAMDGRQLYIGDLHCHDYLSEAEAYPDAVYRWAIEDRRLDFISVVPQSHGWHDNETWILVKYMNERHLTEGAFVTFLGFEWQHTGFGDKVIHYLGGDQPYLPVDDPRYRSAAGLYAALRGSDALVISHHPCYPKGSWCSNTDFDAVETDVERLVELWSMHGSAEGYDAADRPYRAVDPASLVRAALQRGLRLGFTAGSDTHSGRPGGSIKEPRPYWGGLTGVWADALTRRHLFDALRQRRTVALTGARIVLHMTVNAAPMGSEIPAADQAAIQIDVWAPGPIASVAIMKNADPLKTFAPSADEAHIAWRDAIDSPAFYHCRVTLADGHLAVGSPVWVG